MLMKKRQIRIQSHKLDGWWEPEKDLNSAQIALGTDLYLLKRSFLDHLIDLKYLESFDSLDNQNKTPHINLGYKQSDPLGQELYKKLDNKMIKINLQSFNIHQDYIDIDVGHGKHMTICHFKNIKLLMDKDLLMSILDVVLEELAGTAVPCNPVMGSIGSNSSLVIQTHNVSVDAAANKSQVWKTDKLAVLFASPVNILFVGTFDEAVEKAKSEERWLLVNIQDPNFFPCHALNRDIWNQPQIQNIIAKKFIFIQSNSFSTEGETYLTIYKLNQSLNLNTFPHVAIIDPHTKQKLFQFKWKQNQIQFDYKLIQAELLKFLHDQNIKNFDPIINHNNESEEQIGVCCICMDKKSDCLLSPCNHACVCAICSLALQKCPICNGIVISKTKIFIS